MMLYLKIIEEDFYIGFYELQFLCYTTIYKRNVWKSELSVQSFLARVPWRSLCLSYSLSTNSHHWVLTNNPHWTSYQFSKSWLSWPSISLNSLWPTLLLYRIIFFFRSPRLASLLPKQFQLPTFCQLILAELMPSFPLFVFLPSGWKVEIWAVLSDRKG